MAGGFLPLVASGPAAPLTIGIQTVGDSLEADYQRQIADGKSPDAAAQHAIDRSMANGATQALLFELLPKPLRKLGDKAVDKFGRAALTKFLAARGAQTAEGAALGGTSKAAENVVMERPIDKDVGESAAGLGLMQGGLGTLQALLTRGRGGRASDTGKNVPESPATLTAQQEQLLAGRRPAQMFPLGTEELPVPEGFARVETPRGVFHFNPKLITADDILTASQRGRENDVLALGEFSKADVDATGGPAAAITERTPAGAEVKAAVASAATAPRTATELERTKTPGNTVQAEPVGKVVQERGKNFVQDLLEADLERQESARADLEKEVAARQQRQGELDAKKTRFEETLQAARRLANSGDFPAVNGALESMRFYAEDNSLGLAQPQRDAARKATAVLEQRAAALKPAWEAAQATTREASAADQAKTAAAANEARKMEKQAVADQAAAGIGTSGKFEYGTASESALNERAATGDARAIEEITRRGDRQATDDRERLLDALEKIKLPATDQKLGGELKLLQQETSGPQWARLVSKKSTSLDSTAEALRERGFSSLKTPSDVIDAVQRALRGEDVRADHGGEADFAAAKRTNPETETNLKTLDKPVQPVAIDPLAWDAANRDNRKKLLSQSAPRTIVNADTGATLTIDRNTYDHAFGSANGPIGHSIIAKVDDLARSAVRVGESPELPPPRMSKVHRYVAAVERPDGVVVPVRLTVFERLDGSQHVYDLQPLTHKKTLPTGGPVGKIPGVPAGKQRSITVRDLMPGVKEVAPGEFRAEFAERAAQTEGLTDAEAEREIGAIRKAFPALTRDYDLELGLVEDALRARGYRGEIPATAEAAVLRAKRNLIVLAVQAYRDRAKGAALLTHEVAHEYWHTLPADTQAALRELHAQEVREKTGPLYREGRLQTELEHIEEPSARGAQEWFAERIARLNEQWTHGRIDRAEHSLLVRLAHQVREYVRHVWETVAEREGIDPDSALFVAEFRRFFAAGADAEIGRSAGTAYAERAAKFATGKDPAVARLEGELERLREGASQEDSAEIEARGAELTKQLEAAKKRGRETDREAQVAASIKPASALPGGGKEPIGEPVRSVPKVDRRAALVAELDRGRALQNEGHRTGNDAALKEGVRLVKLATERLDDEYPGWEGSKSGAKERSAEPSTQSGTSKPPPGEPPKTTEAAGPEDAGPEDAEPSPFRGDETDTMPVRAGKWNEVYGQDSYQPTPLASTWRKVRDVLTGIRGSVPELPTFPGAKWNEKDTFTRGHATFYNRVREGFRALRSGNDYIQRTAEEQVARIVRPLLEAGGKFEADDYATLRRRQEQVRRLQAEQKPVPPGVLAEIAALNNKLEASPYVLFNRLVLALDLKWRHDNLKDSRG
jgi:hypothetical protein